MPALALSHRNLDRSETVADLFQGTLMALRGEFGGFLAKAEAVHLRGRALVFLHDDVDAFSIAIVNDRTSPSAFSMLASLCSILGSESFIVSLMLSPDPVQCGPDARRVNL